jgi:hypothetical protein
MHPEFRIGYQRVWFTDSRIIPCPVPRRLFSLACAIGSLGHNVGSNPPAPIPN